MIALFYYLVKVILCSGILYGYYHFALRNKVFHEWNRFFLLTAVPFSILLPLIDINIMAPADNDSRIIAAMQIVAGADEYILDVNSASAVNWSTEMISLTAYAIVSIIFMLIFSAGIFRIMKMIRKYQPVFLENFYFINTNEPGTPFSFFKYLLWNEEISLGSENGKRILEHELVHIREKHSWDKVFIHIVLIFFWVNPFFWLIRREMSMIHEFIADRRSVGTGDVKAFAKLILEASFPSHAGILTNSFFQSSIKRRLAMITKKNNPRVMYISRLMMIPLVFLLVFTFAVKAKTLIIADDPPVTTLDQKYTVVVDAGHGGDDDGAVNGMVKEKNINLELVMLVKSMNVNPNINIVLSRDNDFRQALQDRVRITEETKASLFLSIHTNAAPSPDSSGMMTYIAGKNLSYYQQNVRFASILLNNLSDIYKTDKKIRQRNENMTFYILDKNVCPAVVLECGFITNQKDVNFITTKQTQEKIAKQILQSIEDYFSKTVLIQPATPAVQVVKPSVKDTVPASNVQKTPPAKVTFLYLNGTSETLTIKEYKERIGREDITFLSDTIKINGNSLPKKNPEVVVQGYTIKKQKDDDSTRYFVDGKEVNAAVVNSINTDNLASVNVTKTGSTNTVNIITKNINANSNKSMTITGTSKGSPPLYILEDKEISEEEMKLIDPEKIESISVLKDKSAETLYGDKGKNGVIVIKLKKRS